MSEPKVSVAIMAHRRRAHFIRPLLSALDRPAVVVWDQRNDRWDTGRRSMLAYHPQATHHVVIQDDAVVARDLIAGVEQALRHIPAKSPMSLYAGRVRPFRDAVTRLVGLADAATSWLAMSQLHWGVGVVMPVELIPQMVAWCDGRPDVANYDKRMSRWFQHQRLIVYYTWPSLVDHRMSPSLVPGRSHRGRHAHRFVGAATSALSVDWAGAVVSVPALSRRAAPARQATTPSPITLTPQEASIMGRFHDPTGQRARTQEYIRRRAARRDGLLEVSEAGPDDAAIPEPDVPSTADVPVPPEAIGQDAGPPAAPRRTARVEEWRTYLVDVRGVDPQRLDGLTKPQLHDLADSLDAA